VTSRASKRHGGARGIGTDRFDWLVLNRRNLGFSFSRIGKTVGRKIKRTTEMERQDKSLRETFKIESEKGRRDLIRIVTNRDPGNYFYIIEKEDR
jgi:hypothetical protein